MNIMLLSMSTFPTEMKHCIASYGEGREEYSYFSQLEPGCKHFIKKLAAKGESFDRIITLCTEETLSSPESSQKQQLISSNEKEADISGLSPYDFFRARMLGFIRNDESAFDYEKQLGADISGCSVFVHSELYPDPESLFEYVKINKDETEITSSINGVISMFDEMTAEKKNGINLFLNAQGGARKNIQIINTVLNMLQSRKYTLAEVSVIEFNSDRRATKFKMLDVTGLYLRNDLSAAMNAFLQYGRADMFAAYYSRYKRDRGIENAPDDSIVDAMNAVSKAILLCDTEGFLNGIKQLKSEIDTYDALPRDSKDSFFILIENDIRNSYKELFDSSDIIADLDVLVKWCLDKNLLQQALTILESKTPFFVFKYGFLYAKKDEETRAALIKLRRQKQSQTLDYKFKEPIYYLINTFCHMSTVKRSNSNVRFRAVLDFVKNSQQTQKMVSGEYSFDLANHVTAAQDKPNPPCPCADLQRLVLGEPAGLQ